MAVATAIIAIVLVVEFSMFHDFFFPFKFLWEQERISELLLSLFLFFWSFACVFLIFFSGRSFFRKITLPLFLFFYLFNIGSYQVSSSPIDFQQADLVVSYFQWWIGSVAENIGLAVLPLVIILIPVTIFVERLPHILNVNFSKKLYFAPVSVIVLIVLGLQNSDGVFDRYPSFFRIPALLSFAGVSDVYHGERVEIAYSESLLAQAEKIILIVDESIRADTLGINAYEKETTPYLSSLLTGSVNFGLAASSSNCSDYSNLILRTGIRKDDIPDKNQKTLKTPSIWQFTKKAGFYNVYLDAQSAEQWKNYQNFMNKHEASFVDKLTRVRQEIAFESDRVARDQLIELLKQPGKMFIMLNKYGMHFPYYRSHPDNYSFFAPVLKQGEPMNDREKSLNSFMNGIRWSVDDWFKGLLSESDEFKNYIIIYTSDHGQNIVDDGTLATHCRPMANRFEGIVPMMIFTNDVKILGDFQAIQSESYNKTSHFQIFPTILRLAGYNEHWVKENYGVSLFEQPDDPPEFFVGDIHGRGSVRKWISIFPTESGDIQLP